MSMHPGYGETPVDPEEAEALQESARAVFGDVPDKIDLFDSEQAISDEVSLELLTAIVAGRLTLDQLLTDTFLRELHEKLYGELWKWAGTYRSRELNIGVDPSVIPVELRMAFDNIAYRWEQTNDWTPRELGIMVHAETVRIHCFVDGNGRTTRLLADLVFLAAQEQDQEAQIYDWGIQKDQYISLLREFDISRDPKPLAAFVPVRSL